MILILTATGCFQEATDGGLQSQPISQLRATDTLIPTNTSPPAEETATPTPSPTPDATDTPFATETADVVNISDTVPVGTPVAQNDGTPPPDSFALTATQFVVRATQTQDAALTQTATAAGIGAFPTDTIVPTLDPLVTVTTAPVLPGADCIHEVRAGDTLFRLSLSYGLLVNDIASRSGVTNIDVISVGQKLTIPGCGTTGFRPPPTTAPIPSRTPFVATPVTNQPVSPPVASGQTYVVQQNDTLFQISLRFGVDVQSIAALNGIVNINQIDMGDTLQIPTQ